MNPQTSRKLLSEPDLRRSMITKLQSVREEELTQTKATWLREMKEYKQKKCIILPDDPWKMKWNLFLIV